MLLLVAACPSLRGQAATPVGRYADKIARALFYVETRYVDSLDLERTVDDLLTDLMQRLDPHSAYIPKDLVEAANEPLDGSFEGVGIEFALLADTLTVQAVIAGGPAEAAGLRAGDKIVAIDDEPVAGVGLSNDDVRTRLRGPKGSRVTVSVLRSGAVQDFLIRRDTIPLESIDAAYAPEKDIIYIKLGRFAQHSVSEFVQALQAHAPRRPKGMIIDLRGNGGGYMHVALSLANLFLEKGQVIVRMKGNGIDEEDRADGRGFYREGPLVVLVDENSASASEILAGALQDWDRAVIVGRRTFGKGLVQQEYRLPDGSQMRLTVARYHTPSGRMVQSPYELGERERYFRQAGERYARGESFSRDSIVLPDSLHFRTLRLGRPVYGGGGILPDVFVPYDTTGVTPFLVRAIGKGLLTDYANAYIDRHRDALSAETLKDFEARYEPRAAETFDGLLAEAAERGLVPESDEDLATCRTILATRLKALLARGILGTTGYWQVINAEEDPAFRTALEILHTWPKALSGK